MELWTFNTEHIQEGETNSRIDIRWSDRIVIIIIIIIIIINVNNIIIVFIIREDKFSLCEFVCLEKKIFKGCIKFSMFKLSLAMISPIM